MNVPELYPWLLLYRRRLCWAFAVAMFFTLVMHMWVSAESLTDLGVFWHHFCGCPVDPDDVRVLLNFPITFGVVGFTLGINTFQPAGVQAGLPAFGTDMRFLLTRPMARRTTLLVPLALAAVAIATVPTLAIALLLGWLRLVHAPSLGHLLATMQQVPAVAALGPHPTLPAIFAALHMGRRYVASLALGLFAYTGMVSQRFLILSTNPRVRLLAMLPIAVLLFPVTHILSPRLAGALMLIPVRPSALGAMPSTANIAVHFLFAAAVVLGCWRLLRTAEI